MREREDLIWNKLATCLLLKVQVRWSLKNGLTINCWLLSLFYLNFSYFVTGILLPRYLQGPINALIFRGLFKLLRKNRGVYSVQWKKIPLEAMFVPPKQNSILTADREREKGSVLDMSLVLQHSGQMVISLPSTILELSHYRATLKPKYTECVSYIHCHWSVKVNQIFCNIYFLSLFLLSIDEYPIGWREKERGMRVLWTSIWDTNNFVLQ